MDQLAQRRNLPAEAAPPRVVVRTRQRPRPRDRHADRRPAAPPRHRADDHPADPASAGRLARLYWRVGNMSDAESLFARLVETNPPRPRPT